MARFTPEQAADALAITQTIYDWGDELDVNSGRTIAAAGVLAEDVRYFVGGEWHEGIASVAGYYGARWDRLEAAGGAPLMRHLITNVRVGFTAADRATTAYQLLFFAATGTPPLVGHADPIAVADVEMDLRGDDAGDWRIVRFDSRQLFQRG